MHENSLENWILATYYLYQNIEGERDIKLYPDNLHPDHRRAYGWDQMPICFSKAETSTHDQYLGTGDSKNFGKRNLHKCTLRASLNLEMESDAPNSLDPKEASMKVKHLFGPFPKYPKHAHK